MTVDLLPGSSENYVVCTSTTRPAHRAGLMIFETDTYRTLVSDGSFQWMAPKPDNAYRIVTSATRPSGLQLTEGWMIYETDTNKHYVYDGAAWQPVGGSGSAVDTELLMWMTRV